MASLSGGAASKLGDRYEGWWTLRRLADVMAGEASLIRLEPPGDTGQGIEFWVDQPDGRWYEQVKGSARSWTIERLIGDGVIQPLLRHIDDGHEARLITASRCDLKGLSDHARHATSVDEYLRDILTVEGRADLDRLVRALDSERDVLWHRLRHVHVEQHTPESLRQLVHLRFELAVQGDPDVVMNELGGWLVDRLHEPVTAPMAWEHLASKGYARRLLPGDRSVLAALDRTADQLRRRVDAARPPIDAPPHPATERLVARLRDEEAGRLVVVDGGAGSGKSTVLADALKVLRAEGWFTCVVRVDGAPAGTTTAAGIGRAVGLDDSPAVLLGGVADGSPAVVVIDQLDAVSNYSGRMSDNFDAVAEVLDQAMQMPGVKVVIAVRSVDLTVDPRLRSLVSNERQVERITLQELDSDVVLAALRQMDVDPDKVDDATIDLLRTPLHLAVFSRLSDRSRRLAHRTLPGLYAQFTDEVRQAAELRVDRVDWSGIVGALIEHMSDHETLSAPMVVLDTFRPAEVRALQSAGVLTEDDGAVSFFHETYFDYLFARGFVASGRDLHDFLVETGQHLFRRAQTRQVLAYLAVTDRNAFRDTTVGLVRSGEVRRHLQAVVLTGLRGLDAGPDDWEALEPIAFSDRPMASSVRSLLTTPDWFDAADETGAWERWLADPATVPLVANELIRVARERPRRIADLVRPHVGTSDAWRQILRALLAWSMHPELVDLAVELIEAGEVDDVRGPVAVNSDFWSIVYPLIDEDPDAAARLAGAHLTRAADRAGEDGSDDPFASGHLPDSSAGGESHVMDIAGKASLAFVEQVLPFVVRIANATRTDLAPDGLRSSTVWPWPHVDTVYTTSDAVLHGADAALRAIARDDPDRAMAFVEPLMDSPVRVLRFLACRTLAAAGAATADRAIDWVISDDANLRLGFADTPSWASRELVEAASWHCSDARLAALTRRLLDYYPEWERGRKGRGRRGYSQYVLLSAVDPDRLNDASRRRLGELERQFPQSPPSPPRPIEAHYVGPPVPAESAPHLSDEDWLRAIHKHRDNRTDWSGDLPVGGARELARLLGKQAEAEPRRFAELALRLEADTPPAHLEDIIRAVAGNIEADLLSRLCRHARDLAGQQVGREICWAIAAAGADIDDGLLTLLEECATDTDPEPQPPSDGDPTDDGQDLVNVGLNSTRGAAARATAAILFATPAHSERLTPLVECLARDPVTAVRAQAANATTALLNHDPETALRIAQQLFTDANVDILGASTAARLLAYAHRRDPETFAPHLRRALDGPDGVARRAGGVWVAAHVHDQLFEPTPREIDGLLAGARLGAAEALRGDPAAAPALVGKLLDDDDANVREAAAGAMRSIEKMTGSDKERLIAKFVDSRSFKEHFDNLFMSLSRDDRRLPATAIDACERAVEEAGDQLGDIRTRHAGASRELISVTLRLYRQGDQPMRRRCLDVIDRLVEVGAYGVDAALSEER